MIAIPPDPRGVAIAAMVGTADSELLPRSFDGVGAVVVGTADSELLPRSFDGVGAVVVTA